MIALLCSVRAEAESLIWKINDTRESTIASKPLMEGRLAGRQVVLCVGGMGKVNAAHAATLLIERFEPEAIVTYGIGGAYPSSGAAIGDVALAREEIAGDEGVLTHEGFKDTGHIGIPLLKTATTTIYNAYPAPDRLLKNALQTLLARTRTEAPRVHIGSFVTLSTCTGTAERARELEQRYHCLCENMEGAAVAQVAGYHGIPWLEVRGISNLVEDRDLGSWKIPAAAAAAGDAVFRIVEGWSP